MLVRPQSVQAGDQGRPGRCFAQLLQNQSAVGWMCLRLSGLSRSVMNQPWELEWPMRGWQTADPSCVCVCVCACVCVCLWEEVGGSGNNMNSPWLRGRWLFGFWLCTALRRHMLKPDYGKSVWHRCVLSLLIPTHLHFITSMSCSPLVLRPRHTSVRCLSLTLCVNVCICIWESISMRFVVATPIFHKTCYIFSLAYTLCVAGEDTYSQETTAPHV